MNATTTILRCLYGGAAAMLILVLGTGSAFGQDLVVTGAGSFSGAGTYNVKGNINTSGASGAVTMTGRLNVLGTGAQSLGVSGTNALTLDTLSLSGGNTKTMAVNVTVSKSLSIGASTTFAVSDKTLGIGGSSSNSGTFDVSNASSIVDYTGASAQALLGGVTYGGQLNLSGAGAKNLGGAITVTGAFTHAGGALTADQNLTLSNTGGFGTMTDVSATKSVSIAGTGSITTLTDNHGTIGFSAGGTITTLTANHSTINGGTTLGITTFTANTGTINAGTSTLTITDLAGNGGTISAATNNGAISFTNAAQNSGTITSGTGGVTFSSTLTNSGSGSINGNTNGALTFTGALTNSSTSASSIVGGTTVSFGSTTGHSGGGTITAGSGTMSFAGIPTLTGNSILTSGGGTLDFNANIANTAGTISLTGAAQATIAGEFTSVGTLSFASGSTVTYDGNAGNKIAPATYGNLVIAGTGNKDLSTGNATVVGNLTLTNDLTTNANKLTFNTASSNVLGAGEVIGSVERTHSFAQNVAYKFNRPEVTMKFTSGVQNAPVLLTMNPATTPTSVPGSKYVNRKYAVSSTATGNNYDLQLYYTDAELVGSPNENKLGFRSYSSGAWSNLTTAGGSYTRNNAGATNTVLLTVVNVGPNGITEYAMLPMDFITIASGSWNAIATWGTSSDDIPTATDDATVKHTVGMGGASRSIANLIIFKDVTYTGLLNVDTGDFTASGNVTTQAGAGITVSSARNLQVNGILTNAGTITNNGAIAVGP